MSNNKNKNQTKQFEEIGEGEESVNWKVVAPLLFIMAAVFIAGFLALS